MPSQQIHCVNTNETFSSLCGLISIQVWTDQCAFSQVGCESTRQGFVAAAQVTAVKTALASGVQGIIPEGCAAILLAAGLSMVTEGVEF